MELIKSLQYKYLCSYRFTDSMAGKTDKDKVLEIVKDWDTSEEPEYREFRCAKCNKKLKKAWHVWVDEGGYRLEVHFCKDCFEEVKC